MKVSLKDVWAWIPNIPQGIGMYLKCRRIKRDIQAALEVWQRIGGFDASTGQLLNFASDYSVNLVEYATWTPIEWDDQITIMIRNILIDHRDTVILMIEWVRQGRNPSVHEMTAMAEDIHISANNESGSPMDVLYIISLLYQALMWLKTQKKTTPDDDTQPTVKPPTTEPKRPILNFIRKVFNK